MKISIIAVAAALLFTVNAFSMGNGSNPGNKTECPYKASMKLQAKTNAPEVASVTAKPANSGNAQDGTVKN